MKAIAILIVTVVGVSCNFRPHSLDVKGSFENLIKTVPWTWKYHKTSMKAHGPITVDVDVISRYKLKGQSVEKTKGNQYIYYLTKRKHQELRVDLESFTGKRAYAKFSTFNIADESSKYKLTVGGYTGNAGDSLSYHNGRSFSTKDKDNDQWGGSCAQTRKGGWWYGACEVSNLTGSYHNSAVQTHVGITWTHFGGTRKSLKKATMMIRSKA